MFTRIVYFLLIVFACHFSTTTASGAESAKLPDWFAKKQAPPKGTSGEPNPMPVEQTPTNTPASLRRAIDDLIATYGDKYPKGKEYLSRLSELDKKFDQKAFDALHREALLANPLLDFDKILVVAGRGSVRTSNWTTLASRGKKAGENQLAVINGLDDGEVEILHKDKFIARIDLDFDAKKVLFTGLTPKNTYGVFEVGVDGKGRRQLTPDMGDDVDNYDSCYLPSGKIIFNSTAAYSGVPCVGGSAPVANFFTMDANGKNVRRLCFDQDGQWHPNVMANGRVMFLRWEYTDSPHYFTRVLMTMNPDGTDQKAYYGSNSYWPNSLFYARQCPGSENKFVGVVGGHHSAGREGALTLFDVSLGRQEVDGAVQLIPGYGKPVRNITADNLTALYPDRMVEPWPLNDKYFLAPFRGGICLLDVFDNVVMLKKGSFNEPRPFRARPKPPAVPERINTKSSEATVMISDIYEGPGLAGVPRGTVKKLRLLKYEYGPRKRGGHGIIGRESGWDVKMALGTVPVDPDGSANFMVPADTPLSLQPLDKDGKALALMRSWFVGMPGETLACVGCHEDPGTVTPARVTTAQRRSPDKIKPWYGPVRGFAFDREVQPVLDKHCAGCHAMQGKLDDPGKSYSKLTGLVRRGGPEDDYHLLTPLEYHANTSPLMQILEKGHHGVKLDEESWDRIITWMDFNVPRLGTWTEAGADKKILDRRLELRKLYSSASTDPELVATPYKKKEGVYVGLAEPEKKEAPPKLTIEGYPFDEKTAKEMQKKAGGKLEFDVKIDGSPLGLKFVRIPAGEFAMGSNDGYDDEKPVKAVKINKPFYLATNEITLGQYRLFDPNHENGVYDRGGKDLSVRGYYQNNDYFPVIRVSQQQAMEFCKWLSKKIGKKVTLPTEAQWEWACRAGSEGPFAAGTGKTGGRNSLSPVGYNKPNAFGLNDMYGNAAEWTTSDYKPYGGGDFERGLPGRKVVRGGSIFSSGKRISSSFRLGYPAWQRPFDVGFRVMIEE